MIVLVLVVAMTIDREWVGVWKGIDITDSSPWKMMQYPKDIDFQYLLFVYTYYYQHKLDPHFEDFDPVSIATLVTTDPSVVP